jgi:hypothetical protein
MGLGLFWKVLPGGALAHVFQGVQHIVQHAVTQPAGSFPIIGVEAFFNGDVLLS